MVGNSLIGLYIYSRDTPQFCYGIFKEVKGLNFLTDAVMFSNPKEKDILISPKTLVVWND